MAARDRGVLLSKSSREVGNADPVRGGGQGEPCHVGRGKRKEIRRTGAMERWALNEAVLG